MTNEVEEEIRGNGQQTSANLTQPTPGDYKTQGSSEEERIEERIELRKQPPKIYLEKRRNRIFQNAKNKQWEVKTSPPPNPLTPSHCELNNDNENECTRGEGNGDWNLENSINSSSLMRKEVNNQLMVKGELRKRLEGEKRRNFEAFINSNSPANKLTSHHRIRSASEGGELIPLRRTSPIPLTFNSHHVVTNEELNEVNERKEKINRLKLQKDDYNNSTAIFAKAPQLNQQINQMKFERLNSESLTPKGTRRKSIAIPEFANLQDRKRNLVKNFELNQPTTKYFIPELSDDHHIKPGSDYFLTDEDKERIRQMEFHDIVNDLKSDPKPLKENSLRITSLGIGKAGSFPVISNRGRSFTHHSVLNLGVSANSNDNENRKLSKKILNYLRSNDENNNEKKEEKTTPYKYMKTKNKSRKLRLLNENEENLKIRMRNKVINEILVTERDYIDDLHLLLDYYGEPLMEKHIISESKHSSIFRNLSTLIELNESMIKQLENDIHRDGGPFLLPFFQSIINCQKIYSDYCSTHHIATKRTKSLLKKSIHFRQFIEEQQAHPRSNRVAFEGYLIKPVQRICKYPLLLRELMKNIDKKTDEWEQLEKLSQRLSSVVNSINETIRVTKNFEKISKVQRAMGLKEMELLRPGREFVRKGYVEEIVKGDQTPRSIYYCLFNDILLRAEKKKTKFGTSSRERYSLIESIPLYSIKISDETSESFELNYNKKVIKVIAKEKEEWTNTIKSLSKQLLSDDNSSIPSNSLKQRKLNCYLNRGSPQQRIRKFSINNIKSLDELRGLIKKEFDWNDFVNFNYVYIDKYDEEIEISSSTTIDDVLQEAKGFIISSVSWTDSI